MRTYTTDVVVPIPRYTGLDEFLEVVDRLSHTAQLIRDLQAADWKIDEVSGDRREMCYDATKTFPDTESAIRAARELGITYLQVAHGDGSWETILDDAPDVLMAL